MKHLLIMAIAALCIAACNEIPQETQSSPGSGDNVSANDTNISDGDDTYADSIAGISTVALLQKHSVGNGFHVVIMADGYTQSDITNGNYRKAVQKAANALFEKEPMSSLRDYIDIIEVAVPSNEAGVDNTQHDTALRTYFPDNTTNVYGDSIAIQMCALRALVMVYNLQNTEELLQKFNNTLIITLLNSSTYKGVTLMNCDETVSDLIPAGCSLSYVPVAPIKSFGGTDINIMPYLIRHEGIGHGIGKLADEYSYTGKTPTTAAKSDMENWQKYGLFMNIKYDETATTPNAVYPIESSSWLYELQQNAEYGALDINWYTGAFEYPIKFCRCSDYSIMNSPYKPGDEGNDPNNNTFNTAARAMIYKRIMRAADPSYVWDLYDFITFDEKGRAEEAESTTYAAKAKAVTPYLTTTTTTEQPLVSPRIVQLGLQPK